ncbi:MAG: aryl-alcohol dehydrogenase-like predicted oxidoreductase, partial [Myxococcota bacterium]
MKRVQLGGSGLEISRVVFGSMGQHPASEAERITVIRA